jgi:membrane-bound serine protease (ClpP class)
MRKTYFRRHHPISLIRLLPLLFLFFPLLLISSSSQVSAEDKAAEKTVLICPVSGDIFDGVSVLVDRVVKKDSKQGDVLVFSIDTFGGRVDAAIDIAASILESPIPTIAYIHGKGAISAGALIAYACDTIVMAPSANIGASTPVMPGVEMDESMNEKSMSFLRAKYRALGETNGHNPLIGEAMVDPKIELYASAEVDGSTTIYKIENGRVMEKYNTVPAASRTSDDLDLELARLQAQIIPENAMEEVERAVRDALNLPETRRETNADTDKDQASQEPASVTASSDRLPEGLPPHAYLFSPANSLLTLTAREALEVGLIAHTASSQEEALQNLGYSAFTIHHLSMTFAERVYAFLTSPLISALLLLGGLAGIYIEIKTPGFGLPGLLGILCIALYFGSRVVLGIVGWLDLLLVIAGVILLILEIFFIPGFGITGISGIICLVLGIWLSLTRVPIPTYTWDYVRLRDSGMILISVAFFFFLFVAITWRFLPRSSFARKLILTDAQNASEGFVVQDAKESRIAVGLRGQALTMLRPAGRARFGNTTYDVMTEGEFLEKGTAVEIILVEGNRYLVQQQEEED